MGEIKTRGIWQMDAGTLVDAHGKISHMLGTFTEHCAAGSRNRVTVKGREIDAGGIWGKMALFYSNNKHKDGEPLEHASDASHSVQRVQGTWFVKPQCVDAMAKTQFNLDLPLRSVVAGSTQSNFVNTNIGERFA